MNRPGNQRKKRHRGQMSEATSVMAALTISGGLQDAYSYFVRGKVFANAQTGNIVLMAHCFFSGDGAGGMRYLVPLVSFALGVLVAEQIRGRLKQMKALHWRQIVALLEVCLLFVVGFLPGGELTDMLANALTSFCCALQVQTFRKVKGYAYASTMCIGNMRGCMAALSEYFRTRERPALLRAREYFLILVMFFIGAGVGGHLAAVTGRRTIWISVALLIVCFLLMFLKEDISEVEQIVEKKEVSVRLEKEEEAEAKLEAAEEALTESQETSGQESSKELQVHEPGAEKAGERLERAEAQLVRAKEKLELAEEKQAEHQNRERAVYTRERKS